MKNQLLMNQIDWSPLSIGSDRFGRVFTHNGRILRAIFPESEMLCMQLFNSGFIDELISKHLIPRTHITDFSLPGFSLIIEHESINPMNYPYEWTFDMFKDAAATVLHILKIAVKYNLTMKDCHAYNIAFNRHKPVYIDLGSFIPIANNAFPAEKEFEEYYLNTLYIWSRATAFVPKSVLANLFEILSGKDFNELFVSENKQTLKQKIRNKLQKMLDAKKKIEPELSKIEQFEKKIIAEIKDRKSTSEWANYHAEYLNERNEIIYPKRFFQIIDYVRKFSDIRTVSDLGGNQGFFCLCLEQIEQIERINCIDYDENAVNAFYNYLKLKPDEHNKIECFNFNVVLPINPLGHESSAAWAQGRFKADAVFVLALTHHLLLSQNIAIEYMFDVFSKYTNKYIFIEFMPLGLWNGTTAPSLPDWYNETWFEVAFTEEFELLYKELLEPNRLLFVGQKISKLS